MNAYIQYSIRVQVFATILIYTCYFIPAIVFFINP